MPGHLDFSAVPVRETETFETRVFVSRDSFDEDLNERQTRDRRLSSRSREIAGIREQVDCALALLTMRHDCVNVCTLSRTLQNFPFTAEGTGRITRASRYLSDSRGEGERELYHLNEHLH